MRYRDNLPLVSANAIRMVYMLGSAIMLQLYLKELGASPFEISLLEVTFWAALLIFSPLWGAMSDASGRRKIFLVASIVSAAAVLPMFSFLSTTVQVLALRFGFSVLASAFPPVALAAMSAGADKIHRGKDLAPYNVTRAIGFLIGWGTSGLLVDMIGFRYGFYTLGLVGALGFVAALLIGRETVDAPESLTAKEVWNKAKNRWVPSRSDEILTRHGLNYLYAGLFLRKAGLIGTMSLIAVYAVDVLGMSASLMGVLLALNPLNQFLFISFFGDMTDRYGRKKIMLFGFLMTIPIPLLLSVAYNPIIFGAAYVLLGVSFAALVEGTTAFIGDVAPTDRQGEFMGFRKSSQGLAGVTGPLLAGGVATVYGYTAMLYVMAGLIAAASLLIALETEESLHGDQVHDSIARDVVGRIRQRTNS